MASINRQNLYRNNYIPWLIYHFIAYFNAVDMLFAQLAKDKINIHLNIAAIVIEMVKILFHIIAKFSKNIMKINESLF